MGEQTAISWCHHTMSGWVGCEKRSAACKNCYAEAYDKRGMLGGGGHWGKDAPRHFFGDAYWRRPLAWNRAAEAAGERRRVFAFSLGDWAEDRDDLIPHRKRLFETIRATSMLDWLLLTKREENLDRFLPWMDRGRQIDNPWPNVWVGVTAENNEMAELRILALRSIPAAVRFVSCEPILEHIGADTWDRALGFVQEKSRLSSYGPIDWMIVGDESGRNARPAKIEWIREARDAAARHNVAFHFKQWANPHVPDGIERARDDAPDTHQGRRSKIHLPILDGVQHDAFPRGR